jgi:UDP-N-acetylglucosamine 4-epimerase
MNSDSTNNAALAIDGCTAALRVNQFRWLVTGGAGFIGSHLVQRLLELNQVVTSVDNFANGRRANLEDIATAVGPHRAHAHHFVEGDIRDSELCMHLCQNVDFVLHQAALGSVSRSIEDPMGVHRVNVNGFLNMLMAARQAGVRRFIYAASSAIYGDYLDLPKVEHVIGNPLSPYAATKFINEIYAGVFARCYGVTSIGLRYFNVFGARQDPNGPYSAVIPRWIAALLRGERVVINGDGETTRDFCYVQNVVQANLLAAMTDAPQALNQVFNIAVGQRTSLNDLLRLLRRMLKELGHEPENPAVLHVEARAGDIRDSLADITKASVALGYRPSYTLGSGLQEAMSWFVRNLGPHSANPGAQRFT